MVLCGYLLFGQLDPWGKTIQPRAAMQNPAADYIVVPSLVFLFWSEIRPYSVLLVDTGSTQCLPPDQKTRLAAHAVVSWARRQGFQLSAGLLQIDPPGPIVVNDQEQRHHILGSTRQSSRLVSDVACTTLPMLYIHT